jgi:hypothetical protein
LNLPAGAGMQTIGLVLRDVDGYDVIRGRIQPKHHVQLAEWIRENHAIHWRKHYLDLRAEALSLPDGFELYDPFQEEPALFEIAARLWENFSEEGVADFADRWGDLCFSDFRRTASPIREWQGKLRQIQKIARLLGRTLNPEGIAAHLRKFLWDLDAGYLATVVHGGVQSSLVTFGLGNSLLVQAAEAVSNQTPVRNCEYCGTPISATENRNDRVYCSDSCRVQAYKKRKQTAVAMDKKKKTVRQIAAAVDSDPSTVRGWLKQKGK